MRVLGIDPGTRKLGWGVVERRAHRLVPIAAGVVSMDAKAPLAERLAHAYEQLHLLLDEHEPDAVAVEEVFYARYPNAAIKLGHIRGVVLLAAAQTGKPISEWAPALVKRTVVGRGAAPKEQVSALIAATLGLKSPPPSDAADALAIAITHLSAAIR